MIKIKICGLSSLEQIEMVKLSGADMCGFIFADPSPRRLYPEYAEKFSFSKFDLLWVIFGNLWSIILFTWKNLVYQTSN